MATKQPEPTGRAALGAPAPKVAEEPPLLEGYPDSGQGLAEITVVGLLEEPTKYRVGKPIPQDLVILGSMFNLSDRAAGIYNFRHR